MAEQTFWDRLIESSKLSPRKEKVFSYVVYRIQEGAHLRDVLQEDYVQRNCSQGEIDQIIDDPRLIHACEERLRKVFTSGELDPRRNHH